MKTYLFLFLLIFPKIIFGQVTAKDKLICNTKDFAICHNYSQTMSNADFIIYFKRHYGSFIFKKYKPYPYKKLKYINFEFGYFIDKRYATFDTENYMTDLQLKAYFIKLIEFVEK
jgi:hypothetical protein